MFRLCLVCLALFTVASAIPMRQGNAAIVTFSGQLTSGSGVLGDAPPATPFSILLDFNQNAPGFGTISGGLFSSASRSISVSGGDIVLIESGVSDQALFAINTSGPTGSLAVTFVGDAILDNQVTTQNLVDLINASAPTTISLNFGASGNYTGAVTSAVPEPSSTIALGGLGLTCLFRRRRTIRQRKLG